MWLAFVLFVAIWGTFAFTACLGAQVGGRNTVEVAAALGGSLVVGFGRLLRDDTTLQGSLLSVSLGALFALVLTRGKPARLFDPKRPGSDERTATAAELEVFGVQTRSARRHQLPFLIGMVCLVCAYVLSGATFLD